MGSEWLFVAGFVLLFALGAAIGQRMALDCRDHARLSIPTVSLVWAFCGVHFALVVIAAIDRTWRFDIPYGLALGVGGALAAAGISISLASASAFGSFKRMNYRDCGRLVTSGVYRWSRNPQTVGWLLVLLGTALFRQSAMVIILALVLWLGVHMTLPLEEQSLLRTFGEAYEDYRRHTPRYFAFPGLRRPDTNE